MDDANARRSNVLFISHNAADRPYALALERAIHDLVESDTMIDVRYSTSDEAGPQGGEKWREWIHRQVVEARTALIVVTPHALGKPWLLWEAGACWGAALAQSAALGTLGEKPDPGACMGPRLNVSIAYGLSESECPDPLRGDQIILGANPDRAKFLLHRILQTHEVPSSVLLKAGERMQTTLERYLAAVRTALLQSPSLVTEANVQDWLSRLDTLVRADRLSELGDFQRWMTLAFGRDGEAAAVPIDVRLHRRLGELHLAQKDYARAAEQLGLARRAAPRDIFVLRPLGEVKMKRLLSEQAQAEDAAARDDVESVLAAIEDLDKRAFVSSPEAAALYGKFVRRVIGDPERAAEVYASALQANPNSYYLADLLAQTQLELHRSEAAKVTYRRALDIIGRIGEDNVWSHATAAAAHLVLGDIDGARKRIAAMSALGALTRSILDTIAQGLREVCERAAIAPDLLDELLTGLSSDSLGRPSDAGGERP